MLDKRTDRRILDVILSVQRMICVGKGTYHTIYQILHGQAPRIYRLHEKWCLMDAITANKLK